jgi:hypothetical protein
VAIGAGAGAGAGVRGAAPTDAELVMSIFLHLCGGANTSFTHHGAQQQQSRMGGVQSLRAVEDSSISAGLSGSVPYAEALSDLSSAVNVSTPLRRGGSLVGIIRQEPVASKDAATVAVDTVAHLANSRPHFNVFSADGRVVEVLEVDGGRSNCFLCIIVFLLQTMVTASGPGGARSVKRLKYQKGNRGVPALPASLINLAMNVFDILDEPSLLDFISELGPDP